MPNAFVQVPFERMRNMLLGAGFEQDTSVRGREAEFFRVHARDPSRLQVKVLTSVAAGAASARGCGEDAIRVLALFSWYHQASGQFRTKKLFSRRIYRVNSVEGVMARTLNAMRDAYRACNEFVKTDHRASERARSLPRMIDGDPADPLVLHNGKLMYKSTVKAAQDFAEHMADIAVKHHGEFT